MENQAEDLYLVVGAQDGVGASYRRALSGHPVTCIGLARGTSGNVHWDRRDKNLLWVDLCRTYDDPLRQALRSFFDERSLLPARITVLFAAGRSVQESRPAGGERRQHPEMLCFDALALKNIVAMLEEAVEARAVKEQKPVALRIAALNPTAATKTHTEAFISKFVSRHDRLAHPFVSRSGLVVRPAAGVAAETLVTETLPHILSRHGDAYAVLDVADAASEHRRPWRSPSGANGLPDDSQWQNLMRDKEGMPRNFWSSIIRTRRVRNTARLDGATVN